MDVLMPLVFAAIILVAGIKLISLGLERRRIERLKQVVADTDKKFWDLIAHLGKDEKK